MYREEKRDVAPPDIRRLRMVRDNSHCLREWRPAKTQPEFDERG